MKFYVAAKWEDRELARAAMRQLRAFGQTITYDWTHSDQMDTAQAMLDVEGVRAADGLIVLAEEDRPFKGTYVELGIAIALNKPVFVIGRGMDACIFVHCPNVRRFLSFEDLAQLAVASSEAQPTTED